MTATELIIYLIFSHISSRCRSHGPLESLTREDLPLLREGDRTGIRHPKYLCIDAQRIHNIPPMKYLVIMTAHKDAAIFWTPCIAQI